MNHNIFQGIVKSASMCLPVSHAQIIVLDAYEKEVLNIICNKKGEFKFNYIGESVRMLVKKEGYCSKKIELKVGENILVRLLEDRIYAYCDSLEYKPGSLVNVYVHSSTDYKCELIHNGLTRKRVISFDVRPSCIQNVPDRFFVDTGLDWEKSFSFTIPYNLKSGLYSLQFSTLHNKNMYSLTFILLPNLESGNRESKILVLASSNNWQTYNIWGGRSRYRNFETPKVSSLKQQIWTLAIRFLPENIKSLVKKSLGDNALVSIKNHPNAFQFKPLSIKRPHPSSSIYDTDVFNEFTSHLAAAEWRILAWLERENYNYEVISGYEMHKNPKILDNYKVFILSTHCEYWTKEMFSTLSTFNNDGGAILNLSGNSIYREIQFLSENTLRCVSLRFNDTAEDESKLIGVRFDMRGYGSCAPYRVINPNHWIFDGTNLKKNDLFAEKSLNHNTANQISNFNDDPASSPGMAKLIGNGGSGWETDKLTLTAPDDFVLIAKGLNNNNGGAHMVISEKKSKGIIFSVSSITFGGSLLIDNCSSKITKNVINKCLAES